MTAYSSAQFSPPKFRGTAARCLAPLGYILIPFLE